MFPKSRKEILALEAERWHRPSTVRYADPIPTEAERMQAGRERAREKSKARRDRREAQYANEGAGETLDNYFVNGGGCWVWLGKKDQSGYPMVGDSKGHRLAYAAHHGVAPGDKMVCHTCDNPKCINPEHLFLGTAKDNYMDMVLKGRAHPSFVPASFRE